MRGVSSQRIENWLGAEQCKTISRNTRGWYGKPLSLGGVPGAVYVDGDGEFVGRLDGGQEGNLEQAIEDIHNAAKFRRSGWARKQGGGFGDVTAAKNALLQHFQFSKSGSVTVLGAAESMWKIGALPPAAGVASNAPGGTAFDATSTATFKIENAPSGQTLHYYGGWVANSIGANALIIYDRLFAVNKTMNSTATEAVTGVPTRYQSTTSGAVDSAENNFIFPEVGGTTLAATAHNWTVCQYTNQAGTTGQSIPSIAGVSGAASNRVDLTVGNWFMPLASGDTGVKALTQMQCSAAVATGVIEFVIGHAIGILPALSPNFMTATLGVNSAFNFVRIEADACLALMGIMSTASAVNWRGNFYLGEG